jgi:5-methylcytosine-specific restriction protein A
MFQEDCWTGGMDEACAFCKRQVPTRGHHVVPRCKGGRDIAPTCHSCEDFIHKTWTHNELRDEFNTVEKIQNDPRFQKFLRWLYRQQAPERSRSGTPILSARGSRGKADPPDSESGSLGRASRLAPTISKAPKALSVMRSLGRRANSVQLRVGDPFRSRASAQTSFISSSCPGQHRRLRPFLGLQALMSDAAVF